MHASHSAIRDSILVLSWQIDVNWNFSGCGTVYKYLRDRHVCVVQYFVGYVWDRNGKCIMSVVVTH